MRAWERLYGIRTLDDQWIERERRRERKASALLARFLTPEQLAAARVGRDIEVRGSSGGRWLVGTSYFMRVRRQRRWRRPIAYCINAEPSYPWGDRLLALVLMIQTDERAFRREAVRIGVDW